MNKITSVVPYYNSQGMLEKQIDGWLSLPRDLLANLLLIVVDDGSQEKPAYQVLKDLDGKLPLRLYRVLVDIPWNQHGCRNLGAMESPKGWMFMSDIDHQLPEESLRALMTMPLDPACFYTLQRVTAVKKEDGNFKYDLMTDAYGKLKPHPNTFLLTKGLYWKAGGYNEDFCGSYGGDGPFARMLDKLATRTHLADIMLVRWTRDVIPDASQPPEYREAYRALYRERFRQMGEKKEQKPENPVRFPWERLI